MERAFRYNGSMRYLTRSYVEWLGLPLVPLHFRRNRGVAYIPENGCLPLAGSQGWRDGVIWQGRAYERHESGLSFDLVELGYP